MTKSARNESIDNAGAGDPQMRRFLDVVERTAVGMTRRDLFRWGAVAAGAAAMTRTGIAAAAPAVRPGGWSAYAPQDDIESDVTLTVPINPYGMALTLDPHRAINWGALWNIFPNVWGGLVRYDENGKVQYDLAESHVVSEDGLTYTFKIRPDARYATGNAVQAQDFLISWKRALDPANLSPMAGFMEPVKGFRDYINRTSTDIGFSAPDDQTVVVELAGPYTFFLSYLAAYCWSVIDPAALASAGDEGFPLADAGTGPWRFTEFDAATRLVMEPNANHYGGVSPSITKLVWPFVSGTGADTEALDRYKADEFALVDVPVSLKATVERDPEISGDLRGIAPEGVVRAIGMDFKQAPFDDVRVRMAVAQGIDKATLADEVFEGAWSAATSFTPPVLKTLADYEAPEAPAFDADAAKGLLEDAGYANGEGLPEILYLEPSEDTDDEKARWALMFSQLAEATGIQVVHDTSRSAEQITALQGDNGGRQFDIVLWWNVTETPHLLVDAGHSLAPSMAGWFNWSSTLEPVGDADPGADSAAFDDLVAKADKEPDQAARNDLFKQAEELLLKNAVYVPLMNWKQNFLQKPWLIGTKQGPWTGRVPVWFDKDVVVLKR